MNRGCLTALVVVAAIIGGGVLWYRSAFPTYTYRYRIIVNVETPEGVQSASSVIEINEVFQPRIGDSPSSQSQVRGEAVFVDLGNGKNVVALLAGGQNGAGVDYPWGIVFKTFKIDGNNHDMLRAMESSTERRVLSWDHYPTFVTFTDLKDPLSARVVSQGQFESVFGPGTRLRDVTIEMTKDDVTRGIEKKLPWWGMKFSEMRNPDGTALSLDQRQYYAQILGSFKRGQP